MLYQVQVFGLVLSHGSADNSQYSRIEEAVGPVDGFGVEMLKGVQTQLCLVRGDDRSTMHGVDYEILRELLGIVAEIASKDVRKRE